MGVKKAWADRDEGGDPALELQSHNDADSPPKILARLESRGEGGLQVGDEGLVRSTIALARDESAEDDRCRAIAALVDVYSVSRQRPHDLPIAEMDARSMSRLMADMLKAPEPEVSVYLQVNLSWK